MYYVSLLMAGGLEPDDL